MGCYAHANAFIENDSYKKSKGSHPIKECKPFFLSVMKHLREMKLRSFGFVLM